MKSSFLATLGLVAAAAAQWPNLPQCEQTCRDNMVGAAKSSELGCSAGDLRCLCTKQDFIYGLRDCSRAICNSEEAADLLEAGLRVCRDAGVQITTGGGGQGQSTAAGESGGSGAGTATGSGAGSGAGGTVSTIFSTIVTDGSTITTAVATTTLGQSGQVIIETITQSDGDIVRSTLTTIGVTEATGSEASATGTATENESGASSGENATGTEATGTEATGTGASGTETGSGSGASESAASSSTSGNAGVPQMTAAPVGMLAAAGLAVLML